MAEKLIINLILEESKNGIDGDFEKFKTLKTHSGITKPNTEILRENIRTVHTLLFG